MAFRWCCLAMVCVGLSGCEMLHNLQPHRLRRLNYVPPPHLDPEFTLRQPQHAEPLILRAQNDDGPVSSFRVRLSGVNRR